MGSGEQGSALVIAVLVMAILTLLGLAYVLMADTENRIAENEKLAAQSLYFGEGVTREVKRWFDRPPYSATGGANLVRPTTSVMDRTQRQIDVDGPGPASTTTSPYYKAGVDLDLDGNDDVFEKPYRPALALADAFLGTSDGPDVRMDRSKDAATAAFLDALADKIMPGFPAGAAGILARIKRIDVFAPPYLDAGGGNWMRYGIATVRVRVQILRDPGSADEQILADRTVTAVLNEMPYAGAFGPLHSCDELAWSGSFNVHWGAATAIATGDVPTGVHSNMSLSVSRDLPPTARLDLLRGHLSPADDTVWTALVTALQGQPVEDPWFRFIAGLGVAQWSARPSPQVYPVEPDGQDESNKFQNYLNVPCPEYDYATWKRLARSGGSDVHYYAWDEPSLAFRENGAGTGSDLQSLTNGKTGVFFFDTRDGLAPHDFNASNLASNLTPGITIDAADYGVRGFMYVNAERWRADGSPGRPATFTLPGEPFRDENENGVKDGGEEYINLRYGAFTLGDALTVDATNTYGGSVGWNARGPSVTHDAIVWGILYLSGQFEPGGTPFYNGSVITYAGVETGVSTPGTASLYWDPNLKDNWPPPGWDLPRVMITRWQTD